MAYTYGHKSSAFNGIWLWLQRNGFTKATRGNDQSYNYCITMMREFLTTKGIQEIKWKGRFDTTKNGMAVQKHFQEFVQFMKNKEPIKTEL